MPADGLIRTRTDAVVHALEAARLALEQHLRTTDTSTPTEPLVEAHRNILRAAQLLTSAPRVANRRSTTAPVVPLATNDTPDDLTRIRGVDAKAVERLGALGITRFEQIATWEPEDVRSIGLALDLGRGFQNNGVVDQAKMLLAPLQTSGATRYEIVAGWSPRSPHVSFATSQPVFEPLTVAELNAVHATLRWGPGKTALRNLALIVPAVARLVHIPNEEFVDVVDDAPWQPSPLMETAMPAAVQPARAAVAIATPVENSGDVVVVEPMIAADDFVITAMPNEPPAEKPLHLVTLDRIAALDAEITSFGARPDQVPAETAHPKVSDPSNETPITAAVAPVTLATARSPIPRLLPLGASPEEAAVTIKVRSGQASSMLQPMSELLLQPKRRVAIPEPQPDAPTEVTEAAVVIVKRRAKERAAPDLEFYKRDAAGDDRAGRTSSRVEGELAS